MIIKNTFICPCCGEEKPLSDAVVCEGSEVVNSIPIEDTSQYVRYLQRKRIYKFRRCESCNRTIDNRETTFSLLLYIGIALIAIGFFTIDWLCLIGILFLFLSFVVLFIWKPLKFPQTYERAKECDALVPLDEVKIKNGFIL